MSELRSIVHRLASNQHKAIFTVSPGSGRVIIEIHPLIATAEVPGLLFRLDQLTAGAEAIRDYFMTEVTEAFIRQGIRPNEALMVPFDVGPAQVIIALTREDVLALLTHLGTVIAYSQPREAAPRRSLFVMSAGHLEAT